MLSTQTLVYDIFYEHNKSHFHLLLLHYSDSVGATSPTGMQNRTQSYIGHRSMGMQAIQKRANHIRKRLPTQSTTIQKILRNRHITKSPCRSPYLHRFLCQGVDRLQEI